MTDTLASSLSAGVVLGTAVLLLAMMVFFEVGRRIGIHRMALDPEGLAKGGGAAEGAVFGLLGLLIAFTFSGAATRFEERRQLITEEVNAIGTAYLRLDLLAVDLQPQLRTLFRRYVEGRVMVYADPKDSTLTEQRLAQSAALQQEIWSKSLQALQRPATPGTTAMLLLPALNEMIDMTTTRLMATRNHPPLTIFLLLGGLSFVGAMLIGYGMAANAARSWLHAFAFAIVTSVTIYVILDLEFPRLGLLRVDSADIAFIELRRSMD